MGNKMNDNDILYVLKDTNVREGEMLSVFTDIDEAKWFCQLWLTKICNEKDQLEWKAGHKGIYESRSKYQTYEITEVTREEFIKYFSEYVY